MQMFESGGALKVRPMHWRATLRLLGIGTAAVMLAPLVAAYLLVIA